MTELGATVAAALVDVTKSFGGALAVDHVSTAFTSGRVHALVGENGAGKSTLMKILSGVQGTDSGHVEIAGKAVRFRSAREAEAAGIAMIPQELDLFEDLTVAENLFVGRRRPRTSARLIDYRAMERMTAQEFARLDVAIDPRARVGDLRAASRQLVMIARALSVDAAVLILDEPTAALTEVEAGKLLAIIRRLAAGGTAVVYISHRLDEVRAIADDLTVLRDGKVVATTTPDSVDDRALVQLMVGRQVELLERRPPNRRGDVVLAARGLGRHGEFSDIDLDVASGEIVGVAGLIGAGRTELAHTLFGVTRPQSGSFTVTGRPTDFHSPRDAMDAGVGYVPEERRSEGLVLEFSVGRNITFAVLRRLSRFGLVRRKREGRQVEESVRALGVKTRSVDQQVSLLSGGNQQKVVLAKALLTEPALLVLDEPTRGVDVAAKAEIHRLVRQLAASGTAILMISSEIQELLTLADRILVMRTGRLVAELDGASATAEQIGAAQAGASAAGASVSP